MTKRNRNREFKEFRFRFLKVEESPDAFRINSSSLVKNYYLNSKKVTCFYVAQVALSRVAFFGLYLPGLVLFCFFSSQSHSHLHGLGLLMQVLGSALGVCVVGSSVAASLFFKRVNREFKEAKIRKFMWCEPIIIQNADELRASALAQGQMPWEAEEWAQKFAHALRVEWGLVQETSAVQENGSSTDKPTEDGA